MQRVKSSHPAQLVEEEFGNWFFFCERHNKHVISKNERKKDFRLYIRSYLLHVRIFKAWSLWMFDKIDFEKFVYRGGCIAASIFFVFCN